MSFLDAEDRAHIALVAPILAYRAALVFGSLALMLVFAVTAGIAVWLFRLTSGY